MCAGWAARKTAQLRAEWSMEVGLWLAGKQALNGTCWLCQEPGQGRAFNPATGLDDHQQCTHREVARGPGQSWEVNVACSSRCSRSDTAIGSRSGVQHSQALLPAGPVSKREPGPGLPSPAPTLSVPSRAPAAPGGSCSSTWQAVLRPSHPQPCPPCCSLWPWQDIDKTPV